MSNGEPFIDLPLTAKLHLHSRGILKLLGLIGESTSKEFQFALDTISLVIIEEVFKEEGLLSVDGTFTVPEWRTFTFTKMFGCFSLPFIKRILIYAHTQKSGTTAIYAVAASSGESLDDIGIAIEQKGVFISFSARILTRSHGESVAARCFKIFKLKFLLEKATRHDSLEEALEAIGWKV